MEATYQEQQTEQAGNAYQAPGGAMELDVAAQLLTIEGALNGVAKMENLQASDFDQAALDSIDACCGGGCLTDPSIAEQKHGSAGLGGYENSGIPDSSSQSSELTTAAPEVYEAPETNQPVEQITYETQASSSVSMESGISGEMISLYQGTSSSSAPGSVETIEAEPAVVYKNLDADASPSVGYASTPAIEADIGSTYSSAQIDEALSASVVDSPTISESYQTSSDLSHLEVELQAVAVNAPSFAVEGLDYETESITSEIAPAPEGYTPSSDPVSMQFEANTPNISVESVSPNLELTVSNYEANTPVETATFTADHPNIHVAADTQTTTAYSQENEAVSSPVDEIATDLETALVITSQLYDSEQLVVDGQTGPEISYEAENQTPTVSDIGVQASNVEAAVLEDQVMEMQEVYQTEPIVESNNTEYRNLQTDETPAVNVESTVLEQYVTEQAAEATPMQQAEFTSQYDSGIENLASEFVVEYDAATQASAVDHMLILYQAEEEKDKEYIANAKGEVQKEKPEEKQEAKPKAKKTKSNSKKKRKGTLEAILGKKEAARKLLRRKRNVKKTTNASKKSNRTKRSKRSIKNHRR